MKKNLLILAVAGLALASCSNDEVVQTAATSDANAISFRPFTTGMTRANDTHFNAANDQFAVTAWATATTSGAVNLYINNAVFSTTDGITFSSASKYYWPSGYNLDFYAYAPVDDGVADQGVDYVDYNSLKVTPGTTIASQPDLVYAKTENWGKVDPDPNNGTAAANEPHYIDGTPAGVTINFAHAESKIIIKLQNTNPNIKVTVGDVKICNLYGAGTYTWSGYKSGGATWQNTDQRGGFYLAGDWAMYGSADAVYTIPMETTSSHNIFDGTQSARDLTNTASTREMILIPQAITYGTQYASNANDAVYDKAYISVQLKIQNQNGAYIIGGDGDNWQEAIWPLTVLKWLPGHKYTYTVDLAGGGYFPDNVDGTDADLDPILGGYEIQFATVTVDSWIDGSIDI